LGRVFYAAAPAADRGSNKSRSNPQTANFARGRFIPVQAVKIYQMLALPMHGIQIPRCSPPVRNAFQ